MRIQSERVLLKYNYPLFGDVLKKVIKNIRFEFKEVHITQGITLLEIDTHSNNKLTVIIDKSIIQFTFKEKIEWSFIKGIIESFPKEFYESIKFPSMLIEGTINKVDEDFNHLLSVTNPPFTLKHMGIDFNSANNSYKITSTIRKNDTKLSIRCSLSGEINSLDEKINSIKSEINDEVLPQINLFIRSES